MAGIRDRLEKVKICYQMVGVLGELVSEDLPRLIAAYHDLERVEEMLERSTDAWFRHEHAQPQGEIRASWHDVLAENAALRRELKDAHHQLVEAGAAVWTLEHEKERLRDQINKMQRLLDQTISSPQAENGPV